MNDSTTTADSGSTDPGSTAAFDTGVRPEELDPERPRFVGTPWGPLALYVLEDRVVAGDAFCPHLEGPLFEGTVRRGATEHAEITCPWHGWRFSLRTGERVDAESERRIRILTTRLGPAGTLLVDPPVS